MVPDKLPGQHPETSQSTSPSTVDVSHLPRKRLLAGSGPKSNGGFQFSDSPAPFPKKTRELPNLSECHNCGYRINTSNGKDRLQTLYSEWRIVLLCKRCIDRVESAELCAYCFAETSEECFRCRNCTHRVHRDCVLTYKGLAPWSYAYSHSGFDVCVDCWIPKSIIKLRSRAILKEASRRRRKGVKLEDVVKDANCGVEKKVAVAARAREKAARKAVEARRAVELATSALGLVTKRDENDNSSLVVDDAELAFQLHRAMNSSRRISKNLCAVNSQTVWDCNGDLVVGESDFREEQENGKRDGGDDKVEVPMKEEEGSCSNKLINMSGDDNSINSHESQSCCKQDESGHELYSNDNGSQCQLRCDMKPDRYLFKYSKRNLSLKVIPNCKP